MSELFTCPDVIMHLTIISLKQMFYFFSLLINIRNTFICQIKPIKTKQNKTKQNKTKQNKTKQSH